MATPRSNIVKLRLTDLEKADWQKAAGGARKLSEFIRATVNAECERQRTATGGLREFIMTNVAESQPLTREAVEQAYPRTAEDVAALEQTAPPDATTTSGAVRVKPTEEQCPRWMHHRPGVYCGSCKKVVK